MVDNSEQNMALLQLLQRTIPETGKSFLTKKVITTSKLIILTSVQGENSYILKIFLLNPNS